jgi:short-subunit dehydrogenase
MQDKILSKYWHLSFNDYKNICSYFNFTPDYLIYKNIIVNIFELSQKKFSKNNFYFYLSNIKKNKFNIYFLDYVTNYFFKDHSFRYILKLVLNFHECKNEDLNFEKKLSFLYILFNFVKKSITELFLLCLFSVLISIVVSYFKLIKPNLIKKIKNKKFLISGSRGSLGKEILEIILSFEFEQIYLLINNEINIYKNDKISLCKIDFENFDNLKNHLKFEEIDVAILAHGFKENHGSNFDLNLIRKTFEINFFSNVKLVKDLKKITKKIIIISSLGRYHGMPYNSAYNASKSSLSNWIDSINLENNNNFITIFEPGLFRSKMTKKKTIVFFSDVSKVAIKVINSKKNKIIRYPFYFYILSRILEFCPMSLKKIIINRFDK